MHQRAAQVAQDEVSANFPFRISPELTLFNLLDCPSRSLHLPAHLHLEVMDIVELSILFILEILTINR